MNITCGEYFSINAISLWYWQQDVGNMILCDTKLFSDQMLLKKKIPTHIKELHHNQMYQVNQTMRIVHNLWKGLMWCKTD